MAKPGRDQVRVFGTPAEFRDWLTEHHDTARELWVGYYKKHVPKTAMTYPESVEEALCFGWIDGLTYRIDDEVHTVRFTPRRRTSNWSAINIAKVAELADAGRMHPAGIRAFDDRDRRKDAAYSYENLPSELPSEQEAQLRSNAEAWAYWQAQRPSYRRAVTHWVLSAKRAETRERRLTTLVEDCAAGRPIKPLR